MDPPAVAPPVRPAAPSGTLDLSAQTLSPRQRRWLEPITGPGRLARALLFGLNRLGMRLFFRLRSVGLEHVPETGPVILAPNHTSSLDPFALAAALDARRLSQTWWAGWRQAVLRNPFRTFINRLAQTVPIEKDASGLTVGAEILRRNRILVWFPEGHRSPDGRLQPFKRGIGILLRELGVPVVPVHIEGTHRAMPPEARLPRRFPKMTVTFGRLLTTDELGRGEDLDQLVAELRSRVAALADGAATQRVEPVS
jgi:long-chain acyl-CoA synthetase